MLNIPKTQWDGVVNDPVPLTFLANDQKIYEMRNLWNVSHSVDATKLRAALPSMKTTPLAGCLKDVLVF